MKSIDTRDLYKRLEELSDLRSTVNNAKEELQEAKKALAAHDPEQPNAAPDDELFHEITKELEGDVDDATDALDDAENKYGTEEQEELAALEALMEEIGERTMRDGEQMIPTSNGGFEDYAREIASDLYGKEISDAKWPFSCIDWERAAEELEQDHTLVSFQGEDYLIRL